MLSDHSGEAVARGIGVVRLRKIGDGSPHDKAERTEIDIFDSLDRRASGKYLGTQKTLAVGKWQNPAKRCLVRLPPAGCPTLL